MDYFSYIVSHINIKRIQFTPCYIHQGKYGTSITLFKIPSKVYYSLEDLQKKNSQSCRFVLSLGEKT